MIFEPAIAEWASEQICHEDCRNWSELPGDFEACAVARAFFTIRPHMNKKAIKQRVAASKACTFADLRKALAVQP